MFYGSPGVKILLALAALVAVGAGLSACGSSSKKTQASSGLSFRAFISNPDFPTISGGTNPVLQVMDASRDLLPNAFVSLSSASASVADAGLMVVSPKKDRTLVFSPSDTKLAVINNSQEAASTAISLPGSTESMVVASDNLTAFVAVPSAPTQGQGVGVVERIDISGGTVTASVPVPGAHYLIASGNGSQILVFSDAANSVTLLTPSLIGTGAQINSQQPCSSFQTVACTVSAPGLDRPVWAAVSSSGSTAYIMNCGPECGGTTSSISVLDLTPISGGGPPVVTSTIPVPAASTGLLQGSMLYVAGSLPGQSCNANAGLCGQLSVLDLSSGAGNVNCVAQPANPLRACRTFAITDGYHNRVAMGSNGQLFLGARNCTNVNTSSLVRGCLAIFDTTKASVVLPPDNGDVTGIEPIPNRNIVYLCQGGKLRIYDTTNDLLQTTPAQPNIIGQAIDVRVVDF